MLEQFQVNRPFMRERERYREIENEVRGRKREIYRAREIGVRDRKKGRERKNKVKERKEVERSQFCCWNCILF